MNAHDFNSSNDTLNAQLEQTRARQDQLAAKLNAIRSGRVYRIVKALGGWKWLDLANEPDLASGEAAASGNGFPPHFWLEQCEQLWRRIGGLEAERPQLELSQTALEERIASLTAHLEGRTPETTEDPFEVAFSRIRPPKDRGMPAFSIGAAERLVGRFRTLGIPVQDFHVDVAAYRDYFRNAGYLDTYPSYYPYNLPEKSLEHFIAATLLELKSDDVYIDIASEHSPVPDIYCKLFGARTFRQDLTYEPGLIGDRMGGDAAAMPVSDGFATKLALHCSFEHFEGESDSRFISEVARVLRPGGSACFVPFYIAEERAIITDPEVADGSDVEFQDGVTVYGARGWGNRFGRFYDPELVHSRLQAPLRQLQWTVIRILGASDVDPSCYARFALVLKRPNDTQ